LRQLRVARRALRPIECGRSLCDGYTGKRALKFLESVGGVLPRRCCGRELPAGRRPGKVGSAFLRSNLVRIKKTRSTIAETCGALLLGVNGICVIGHPEQQGLSVVSACAWDPTVPPATRLIGRSHQLSGSLDAEAGRERSGRRNPRSLKAGARPRGPANPRLWLTETKLVVAQVVARSIGERWRWRLVGCGKCPARLSLSNTSSSHRVETNDAWIRSRTGIAARRVRWARGRHSPGLATDAGGRLLAHAGWQASDLDLNILLGPPSSPRHLLRHGPPDPGGLGQTRRCAFDLDGRPAVASVCPDPRRHYLAAGTMRRVLVIGADQLSAAGLTGMTAAPCVLFGRWRPPLWALRSLALALTMAAGFECTPMAAAPSALTLQAGQGSAHPLGGRAIPPQRGGFQPIQMKGSEVYKFARGRESAAPCLEALA